MPSFLNSDNFSVFKDYMKVFYTMFFGVVYATEFVSKSGLGEKSFLTILEILLEHFEREWV